jgi:hypothetical protein
MKIVKIHGGLGNQMFQYSFALALSARGGEVRIDASALAGDALHNGYELSTVFSVTLGQAEPDDVRRLSIPPDGLVNRFRRKYLTKPTQVIDRVFGYQPELLELSGDRYFEGYWQSEKYFSGIEAQVRRELAFTQPLSERNESLLAAAPRPLASVHVRRGDYLLYQNLDLCTPAYYAKAVDALRSSGSARHFLVFSEDVEYCRATMKFGPGEAEFVGWNGGRDSWQDMAMMARCDSHVVANSSFSWWGAWLDPSPAKRVIAPSIWNRREIEDHDLYYRYRFEDIVPGSWERVPI